MPASLLTVLLVVVRCALGQAPVLQPQPVPAAAGAPSRLVTTSLVDGHLEIRDSSTGEPILLSRGAVLVSGTGEGVKFAVKMNEQPDGLDLVFNFMNTSGQARPVGTITLGTFTLGPSVTYQDLRDTCEPVAVDSNTFLPKSWTYPAELYSPAWVLSSSRYAVGVSLRYPVLEYKHDARLSLTSPVPERPDAEGGRGWVTAFQLSDAGGPPGLPSSAPRVRYSAEIQPGEVRAYTISIRLTTRPDEWVRTLLPYREYFRATYGGVRYGRRADAVQAVALAEESRVSDTSPRGFTDPFRPDILGWTRLTRYLLGDMGDFNRAVLVNPTGLYRSHREFNPPFQMTTAWAALPTLATVAERYDGLPAVTKAGKDLGLWWGNSCRVCSSWDPAGVEALDPFNPEHARLALAEVEGAVRAGVTTIVLGNFNHETTPLWQLHAWLGELAARFPDVRFVTEPSACDVLHAVAPTFVKGWNDTTTARREAELYTIRNPNILADFLLPGHETWAGFTYDIPKQVLRVIADPARVKADMERYASLGYVPCFFWNGRLDGVVAGATTWRTSIPADLRIDDVPPPIGPGSAAAPPAQAAAPSKAPGAAAPGPNGKVLSQSGSKVNVRAAPGTVKTGPNEGEVRQDRDAVIEALRRAGTTSAAAAKTTKKVPTKVVPSEPAPKKPDDPPK